MRQVPQYLIIGDGLMATHACHYFRLASQKHVQWSRSQHTVEALNTLIEASTQALILISDRAIESFITEHLLAHPHCQRVHFSGALETSLAHSVHPLFSFNADKSYTLLEYQSVPFILTEDAPSLSELLPGLSNPSYRINPSEKPYYHAMCVLANNFTTVLWEKFFDEMNMRFSINTPDLMPLLHSTLTGLSGYPNIKKTGPLARGDQKTLSKNLAALVNDPFHEIFKSFTDAFTGEKIQ